MLTPKQEKNVSDGKTNSYKTNSSGNQTRTRRKRNVMVPLKYSAVEKLLENRQRANGRSLVGLNLEKVEFQNILVEKKFNSKTKIRPSIYSRNMVNKELEKMTTTSIINHLDNQANSIDFFEVSVLKKFKV